MIHSSPSAESLDVAPWMDLEFELDLDTHEKYYTAANYGSSSRGTHSLVSLASVLL